MAKKLEIRHTEKRLSCGNLTIYFILLQKELYLNYLRVTVIKFVPLLTNMLEDLICHFMLQH